MFSMLAAHAQGKILKDSIFTASAAANTATKQYGKEKVTNGTIGAIMDDDGTLVCLPTVEQTLRNLPTADLASYAPILGTPDYRKAVMISTFYAQRPDGYLDSVATSGGTGAIHNTIQNYSEIGDTVLTCDWYWGTYNSICIESGRKLATYQLFDDKLHYNIADLASKMSDILSRQDSLVLIINTPAHNPTGYSLTDDEWDAVITLCKEQTAKGKKITLVVDIAYIDYAGEKNESRRFMRKFSNLPENIFVIFAFSMSKGYTLYGQRTGAMIGLSSKQELVTEFVEANKYTGRCTWSNINHGAMSTLATINNDATLMKNYEAERDALYKKIRDRGAVFMQEAHTCGLNALPYKAGFFISVPSDNPEALAAKLHDELIFTVPLKRGIRVAVCSISEAKMHGLAEKTLRAMQALGQA